MNSPLNLSPDETPAAVYNISTALALYVFPALFLTVALLMRFTRVPHPPYFAYICAFGAPGSMSFGLASGNTPLAALAFFIAFPITPLIMVRNLAVLRSQAEQTIYHRGAKWASLLSISAIMGFLAWTAIDYAHRHP